MDDKLGIDQMIFVTGFHTLCKGFELKSGFNMSDDDVKPLDAPMFIAAGASVRYGNGSTGGSSIYRDILS